MPRGQTKSQEPCKFINKLWHILETQEFDSVLSWSNAGNSFQIRDPKALERTILPLYFRHTKLKSFVRQLNMYHFRKVRNQKELLVFQNPHFTRVEKPQLQMIRRKLPKREVNPYKLDKLSQNMFQLTPSTVNEHFSQEKHISSINDNPPSYPSQVSLQWRVKSNCHFQDSLPSYLPLVAPHSFVNNEESEDEEESVSIGQAMLEKGVSTYTGTGWGSADVSWQNFI